MKHLFFKSFIICGIRLNSIQYTHIATTPYSRKVWRGESLENLANRPWFAKLKPSKLVLLINNLLADLLIHQTFFRQMLEESIRQTFPRQTFPLYGISWFVILLLLCMSNEYNIIYGNWLSTWPALWSVYTCTGTKMSLYAVL